MQEVFGRYTLVRRLAVGGMAEIFLAALHGDSGFEKKVVLKRILPHLGDDNAFIKMFIDEAVLAARLAHPNVVQIYDFGSVHGSPYIAMEYIDGTDLHHLLRLAKARGRSLTEAEVACIGEGIARGLAYTHALTDDAGKPLGIVHRDVSPHNVMLSRTGDPKVMDFGIAKAAARFSRTATGTIKGKLAYMAPEQATGQGASPKSDQFALGAVLWECLTGERLFSRDTEVSLMQAVIACEVPPLRALRPGVSPALEAIVLRALHKDPDQRFVDMAAMESELTAFRFALGASGIVHPGDLATEFARQDTEVQGDWSWAEARAPGGTRKVAARAAGGSVQDVVHATPARRRASGPLLAAATPPVRRHTLAAASHGSAPRPRTTWRISRGTRRFFGLSGRRVALSGVLLMLLGIGLPAALWGRSGEGGPLEMANLLRQRLHREALASHAGVGHLSLRTDGPAVDVYLGSARLGSTPIAEEQVPAGQLQLRLVNEKAGIWRNYDIFVPENGSAQGLISDRQ